ncbi:YjcZ family sporulation protein [Ureibacillus sp. Re31]|uniref:YjcZ family sporulation protein n=1 Tax=Ureibacillus galli TaxID=2762222 RepID=A0ABR8XDA3_9BACL|nr:YjcZ family sporulation protein [Ureibacillus galli]MBD8027193.1 YjcZ family sporulation protein [Ureibacillus galli]
MSYSNVGGSYDNQNNFSFALIVVLFILLIIVGAFFSKNYY